MTNIPWLEELHKNATHKVKHHDRTIVSLDRLLALIEIAKAAENQNNAIDGFPDPEAWASLVRRALEKARTVP